MLEYNTQQRKLPLPEYGRSVQNMVDHAVSLTDREERQLCANTIVSIMGNMFPHLRDVADFKHKLWDHLAIMSDFKLDIDYPVEVVRKADLEIKPDSIKYPDGNMHFRHYGIILEQMIVRATTYEEGEEKDYLITLLLFQMKRAYLAWNHDSVDDQKIIDDLRVLSKGGLSLQPNDKRLEEANEMLYNLNRKPVANNRKVGKRNR